MALSMTNDIVATDIAGMSVLLEDKIWLLKGFHMDDLVIKYESIGTHAALKSSSPVLKAIDPVARMKPLKESEVLQLRLAVTHVYNLGIDRDGNDFRPQLFKLLQVLDRKLVPFSKMQKQTVLTLDSAMKRKLAGRGDQIKTFVHFLTAEGGLEALGRVAAGDMVIGNEDRFSFGRQGTTGIRVGDHTFQLKIIYNVGNVMITGTGSHFGPSSLDYIDSGNKLRDGNRTVQQDEKSTGDWWSGRHLMKSSRRKAVADRIVDDLDVLLTPPPSKPRLFSKLGIGARGRIVDGMEEGYRRIMRKLQPLSHTNRLSITMDSAYKLLLVESDLKF